MVGAAPAPEAAASAVPPGERRRLVLERLARLMTGEVRLQVLIGPGPARFDEEALILPEALFVDEREAELTGWLDLMVARRRHAPTGLTRGLGDPLTRTLARIIDDHRSARRLLRDYPGAAHFLAARREARSARLAHSLIPLPAILHLADGLESALWLPASADSPAPLVIPRTMPAPLAAAWPALAPLVDEARLVRTSAGIRDLAVRLLATLASAGVSARLLMNATGLNATGGEDEAIEPAWNEGEDGDEAGRPEPAGDARMPDRMFEAGAADRAPQPTAALLLADFDPDLEGLLDDPPPSGSGIDTPGASTTAPAYRDAHRDPDPQAPLVSIPLTHEFDRVEDLSGRGDPVAWARLRRQGLSLGARLAERLERALQATARHTWLQNQERGTINPAALARLAIEPGLRTPFRVMRAVPGHEVGLSILVDLSASMDGERLQIAQLCTAALSAALSRLDIAFEVLGFSSSIDPGMREYYQQRRREGLDMRPYNRFVERLDLKIFKSFAVSDLSGLVDMRCGDQNPDGECLEWAGERLLAHRARRRIMLVLSDGHPVTGDGDRGVLQADLRRRIRRLSAAGVEMVGIGIGDAAAAAYYSPAIVVTELQDLPARAFEQLSRTLLESGRSRRFAAGAHPVGQG